MYPKGLLGRRDPVHLLSYLLPLQYLVYFKPEWARAWIGTRRLDAPQTGGAVRRP